MAGPSPEGAAGGGAGPRAAGEGAAGRPDVRRRGFVEVRWRQFRRAPRPVVRAVASSLSVAALLGVLYLAYDVTLERGTALPGGDLRLAFLVAYVAVVLVAGAVITWLVVPQPTGIAGGVRRRNAWSLALGLFAAVPIAYLVLVVLHELVRPIFIE